MAAKAWWGFAVFCLTVGAAMAEAPPQTIRICDEAGCVERPRDSVSFVPRPVAAPITGRYAELLALAGTDPQAAYDLGLRYFRGDGVPEDSYQALQWMREAASRGYVPAQTALGRLYLSGLAELGSDPAEAEKWLLIASAQGDKEAGKLLADAQKAKQDELAFQRWREAQREQLRNFWQGVYEYRWQWRDDGRWHERDVSGPRR